VKYYYPQHIQGYNRIKAEGKTAWGEIHGETGFENFSARGFLDAVLPMLRFDTPKPEVFNYGCGTGPDACFLAERGFRVDAVDLIPTAIEIARQQAALRRLNIDYAVQDICDLPHEGKPYDLIVDSFCLQCIVFDEERKRVFSTVRARLKPKGYYLISTAVMDAEHLSTLREGETVTDSASGTVYTRYGDDGNALIDLKSGAVLISIDHAEVASGIVNGPSAYPAAIFINDRWFLPHRRHLTQAQLEAELREAGFRAIYRYLDHDGCLACVKRE
jgi:2-polyprenyl-3-methyl-5-hydroxy-6-metoxy-1,4-benzoquinol methylase